MRLAWMARRAAPETAVRTSARWPGSSRRASGCACAGGSGQGSASRTNCFEAVSFGRQPEKGGKMFSNMYKV